MKFHNTAAVVALVSFISSAPVTYAANTDGIINGGNNLLENESFGETSNVEIEKRKLGKSSKSAKAKKSGKKKKKKLGKKAKKDAEEIATTTTEKKVDLAGRSNTHIEDVNKEVEVTIVAPTEAPIGSGSRLVPTQTEQDTYSPTTAKTTSPTKNPSAAPVTSSPTKDPLAAPITSSPTEAHSLKPTSQPSKGPSAAPVTSSPTMKPTSAPVTSSPTMKPSAAPVTSSPTKDPSAAPVTSSPTKSPTLSPVTATVKTIDVCEDSSSTFKVPEVRNKEMDCSWAQTQTKKKCNYKSVAENCPVTCKSCPSTVADNCEVKVSLVFEDYVANMTEDAIHNDQLEVWKVNDSHGCGYYYDAEYCQHDKKDGAFYNMDDDYYDLSESVVIFDAAGETYNIYVNHTFTYYEAITADADHEMAGEVQVFINGEQVEETWSHDVDQNTHDDWYYYENPKYDDSLVVSMTCDNACQCSFEKID